MKINSCQGDVSDILAKKEARMYSSWYPEIHVQIT